MLHPPALKASLKRGAFIAAANWPLIAVQFIAEGTQQLLLAVPVVGGIVLVVLLLGADVEDVMGGDIKGSIRTSSGRCARIRWPSGFLLRLFWWCSSERRS